MSRNAPIRRIPVWLLISAYLIAGRDQMRAAVPNGSPSPQPPAASRVVTVHDPFGTVAFKPRQDRVSEMMAAGVTALTGRSSVAAAWHSILSTQSVLGIKVFSTPGAITGTRPAVVRALLEQLIEAGFPKDHLIIWDRQWADLRRAGFAALGQELGVRVASAVESGWDEKTSYESSFIGNLVYGDHEFRRKGPGVGRRSFVSRLVTEEITHLIVVSPLLNHNSAGVSGSLYNLAMGSVDNVLRFEGSIAKLAQAVPEIYALPILGDRVVLNIVDALLCQYQGQEIGRLHYSTALNELRFSRDPVALDVLSLEELDRQRHARNMVSGSSTNFIELYQNAALLEIGISDRKRISVRTISTGTSKAEASD